MTTIEYFEMVYNGIEPYVISHLPIDSLHLDQYEIPIGSMCRVHRKQAIIVMTRLGPFSVYISNGRVFYSCSDIIDKVAQFENLFLSYTDIVRVFHPTGNIGQWMEEIANYLQNYKPI